MPTLIPGLAVLVIVAVATIAEAHTHAQCLRSIPCQDAVAAAVANAVLEKNAELADLRDEITGLTARIAELEAQGPMMPPAAPCTLTLSPPAPIPWSTLPPGAVVCFASGEYPYRIEPPGGLGGITLRALTWGTASFPLGFDLAGNAITLEGIRLPCPGCPGGSAVWTRTVSP